MFFVIPEMNFINQTVIFLTTKHRVVVSGKNSLVWEKSNARGVVHSIFWFSIFREKPEEWRWSASPEPICYSDSEPKKSDRSEIVSNHKRSKRDYHSKHTKHSRSRSRSKDLRETEYENDVFSKKKSSRRRKRSRSNSSRRKRHSDRERDETRYS